MHEREAMKPFSVRAIGSRSRWKVCLTIGAVLASMLLSSLFNVLVAWHLHALAPESVVGTSHADAIHAQTKSLEAPVAWGDIVERVCEATRHCPCVIAWALLQTPTWSAQLNVERFAQGPPAFFRSHFMDVPQHPPNGVIAVWG